ncbi:hypothetical protein ACFXTH_045355 [Malus domestica]
MGKYLGNKIHGVLFFSLNFDRWPPNGDIAIQLGELQSNSSATLLLHRTENSSKEPPPRELRLYNFWFTENRNHSPSL